MFEKNEVNIYLKSKFSLRKITIEIFLQTKIHTCYWYFDFLVCRVSWSPGVCVGLGEYKFSDVA